ncbi:GntR family transcriptional regulator [Magnetospirillum aberrantis]|uniref:GntR family transcriptional regulator n=1 Tax=Magnetospirillum aberrantis SpK TaxID=908842 RepID=A0A7C9UYZ0_9PROT|nr:GntR family transcriptional regulator [Magnetospirillum aberrantis]NFV80191.1 GntR family transcriptional regulator [Magnetospirillum aberrantis SpK]
MLHQTPRFDTASMTRAERVRLQLATEIVAGDFRPGTRLDEVAQSSRMGVSRTPLREAVRQLATLGLVENRPHRGVVVGDGVGQALFETLAEMEVVCVGLANARMGDQERGEVARLAASGGDWLAALHRGCGNPVLVGLVETLWQPIRGGQAPRGMAVTEVERSLGVRVAAAVAAGDLEQAECGIREFVRAAAAAFYMRSPEMTVKVG